MNQLINLPELKKAGVSLSIKREDLLHPVISGNKFRKLKYNLLQARESDCKTLLTFGGAYSNHIVATACAGAENGFKTIGVIRGEEIRTRWQNNPSLEKAHSFGMEFIFVSRDSYRKRHMKDWVDAITANYESVYVLPEGGSNLLGVKGCEEILDEEDETYDWICTAVGTGGTLAGLANSSKPHQRVVGFSVLRGDFIFHEISKFTSQNNWTLESSYHLGGYAKAPDHLIDFINSFYTRTGILLDPIYTGKLFFGIFEWISKGKFPGGSKILAIHTGGLQGIEGFNVQQKSKGHTPIEL